MGEEGDPRGGGVHPEEMADEGVHGVHEDGDHPPNEDPVDEGVRRGGGVHPRGEDLSDRAEEGVHRGARVHRDDEVHLRNEVHHESQSDVRRDCNDPCCCHGNN